MMQNNDYDDFEPAEIPRPVSAVGMELFTKGLEQTRHQHREAQLILAVRGLITCEVAHGLWMVPRQCALWIPGDTEHSVCCVGDLEVYTLFIDPELARNLPEECSTFSTTPLLHELLIAVTRLPPLYDVEGADGRLIQTMLDQLERAPMGSLHLPMPADPRLRTIAKALSSDPANRTTIGEWARIVAMSERSLFRLIMSQTGMNFGRWRQQFQVMFAIERLTEGASVQTVSFDLGYESASTFITMFKKVMGQPPGQFLASRRCAASAAKAEQSKPKVITTMKEAQQALRL
ncbi:AraC family transcriptional regulator [Altericroceibacterium endophyticum]|uniref:Helix-turn-helix domain-containing protein n=1 Tax=Altericroceibacterium endophyticum TaxID=1808508 RepID=A0A6I4T4X2_9SPHN|nr:helix-turn-helix transcriptional regulator [Altericroceibacterium endophyticum]MXO65917.1 helix-turn-helix domain-containing protein [Altericroceibacterium endophyticum]